MVDVETSRNNPFASPPIEDEDPADAPLMDGDKIGRWLALPLISGALNGAAITVMLLACYLGASLFLQAIPLEALADSQTRMQIGWTWAGGALYGGVLGAICGLVHGGVAFVLRWRRRLRWVIQVTGCLVPVVVMLLPPTVLMFMTNETPPLSAIALMVLFGLGYLLFGWRMNRNIHKYLLSRLERESREA